MKETENQRLEKFPYSLLRAHFSLTLPDILPNMENI